MAGGRGMNVNGTASQHHDDLSIHVHVVDEMQVFELSGSLDIATSPTVRAALSSASERGSHRLVVDLTRVDFLDSTGLGALIGGRRPRQGVGGEGPRGAEADPDL